MRRGASNLVLGLQGTVDFEVHWQPGKIGALASRFRLTPGDLEEVVQLKSPRDLLLSFLSALREGRGIELAVESTDAVIEFASELDYEITLGGTGVRAALSLLRAGRSSTVHLVSVDENVRRLLPAELRVISSAVSDTLDPHLILQYPAGARIEWDGFEVVAPRANRVIFTNDPPARELLLAPTLGDVLSTTDLFLVQGLNAIRDRTILAGRTSELRGLIKRMPEGSIVIYEDGGFHDPALGNSALTGLADAVDIYSLNEDELGDRVGHTVRLGDPEALAEAVRALRAIAPRPTLVIHTAKFAVAVGPHAGSLAAALEAGTLAAGVRYAYGDDVTNDRLAKVAGGARAGIGMILQGELHLFLEETVVVVPSYEITTSSPTTIGLGDTFIGGFISDLALGAPHAMSG